VAVAVVLTSTEQSRSLVRVVLQYKTALWTQLWVSRSECACMRVMGAICSCYVQQLTSLPGNHTAFCTLCCVHNVRDFLRNKFRSTFFQSTNL
jgi:hypothetical protein